MSLKPVSVIPGEDQPVCTEVGRILLNDSGDLCSCKGTATGWVKVSDNSSCF